MKKECITADLILLGWFFLDMTGMYIGDNCLVERSFDEDGIFFIIYLAAVILFIVQERIGKWVAFIWLFMWSVTQFFSHEWYTIFNSGFMGSLEGKIEYFSDTIHWLEIEGKYIPDVYHLILHIFILWALISTALYIVQGKKHQDIAIENHKL